MFLLLGLLRRSHWSLECIFKMRSSCPRKSSSSDHPPFVSYLWNFKNWNPSPLFAPPRAFSHPQIRTKAQYIILGPYPYNSPSKLRHSRRKSGVLIFKRQNHLFLWFTRVRVLFYMPHNCNWCFEAHEASLNALGITLFPKSNGKE